MTIFEQIKDDIEYPFIKIGNIAETIGDDVYDGGKYVINKIKSGVEIVEGVGAAGVEIGKTVLKTGEILLIVVIGGFLLIQLDTDLIKFKRNRL
jgi:hypothetical protein